MTSYRLWGAALFLICELVHGALQLLGGRAPVCRFSFRLEACAYGVERGSIAAKERHCGRVARQHRKSFRKIPDRIGLCSGDLIHCRSPASPVRRRVRLAGSGRQGNQSCAVFKRFGIGCDPERAVCPCGGDAKPRFVAARACLCSAEDPKGAPGPGQVRRFAPA